ncbi:MAG: hypothetical protein ACK6AT_08520 [Planctomycetota bacterium]
MLFGTWVDDNVDTLTPEELNDVDKLAVGVGSEPKFDRKIGRIGST